MSAEISPQPLYGASFLPGAHHPHCTRHGHHLIWVLSRPLCLGCMCLYSGVLVGFSVSAILRPTGVAFATWAALHLILVSPTTVQPFIQLKWFKILARFALGLATGSYFVTGILSVNAPVSPGLFLVSLPLAFAAVLIGLLRLRRAYPDDPCRQCPLGVFPTCEWNLPRLLATNEDPLLQKALAPKNSSQVAGTDALDCSRPDCR